MSMLCGPTSAPLPFRDYEGATRKSFARYCKKNTIRQLCPAVSLNHLNTFASECVASRKCLGPESKDSAKRWTICEDKNHVARQRCEVNLSSQRPVIPQATRESAFATEILLVVLHPH